MSTFTQTLQLRKSESKERESGDFSSLKNAARGCGVMHRVGRDRVCSWDKCVTCPRRPALVVVKLTSVTTETASGGMRGVGFLVAMKSRKSSL